MESRSMFSTWTIDVPGTWNDQRAYLAIRTRTVECLPYRAIGGSPGGGLVRASDLPIGRKLSHRQQVYLAAVACHGAVQIVESTGLEEDFLTGVQLAIMPATEVIYRATRGFDEYMLKGRYTARGFEPDREPFFPAMPGADELTWHMRRPNPDSEWSRRSDIEAPDPNDVDGTMVDLLQIVAEIIGEHGRPGTTAFNWLNQVIDDDNFAHEQIFGDEPERHFTSKTSARRHIYYHGQ